MKRVVVAIILGPEKLMLMGQRRDNDLWTVPAGHCEPNESAHAAVVREVREETGLYVTDTQLLRCGLNSSGEVLIYLFICKATGRLDTSKDPDQEVPYWTWEDPFDHADELHVKPEENFALQWYAQNYETLRRL